MRLLRAAALLVPALALALFVARAGAGDADPTDPARNTALPCEAVTTQGGVARASKDIVHLANVCGFVGTDVELQSRKDAFGKVHDYAFVGTMGAGLRIYDVTNPAHPTFAGGYADSGWENDIQLRGNIAVATFDGVSGEDSSASTCLKTRYPDATARASTSTGSTSTRRRRSSTSRSRRASRTRREARTTRRSARTAPGSAISNCCTRLGDRRRRPAQLGAGARRSATALIDESQRQRDALPRRRGVHLRRDEGAERLERRGLWRPHDVHFSRDAKTIYVAAINSTWIVDVSRVLAGHREVDRVHPELPPTAATLMNPHNIEISHQADVTKDGKVLVVSDERGGGLYETGCNTDPSGVIGGLHFFALGAVDGHRRRRRLPRRRTRSSLGDYFIPNPMLALGPAAAGARRDASAARRAGLHGARLPARRQRHVSPGPIEKGYDGVSTPRQAPALGGLVRRRRLADRLLGHAVEHATASPRTPRTTWGNTLGWNVMSGADTWSAKEYKGHIFAGDMLRGFDVYGFAACTALGCTAPAGVTFEVDPLDSALIDPLTGQIG